MVHTTPCLLSDGQRHAITARLQQRSAPSAAVSGARLSVWTWLFTAEGLCAGDLVGQIGRALAG
jgi:hypothetical protein